MFADFNLENFPLVKVKFKSNVENDEDFDYFLKGWMSIHNQKKEYTLLFDTSEIGIMNPKYALRTATFIKEFKKMDQQFLKKSIIIVTNKYIRYLMDFVFNFQKPSAPVYIVNNLDKSLEVYNDILNNIKIDDKNVIIVRP